MLHLAWPWILLTLPLPWLLHHAIKPAVKVQEAALQVPFLDDFQNARTGVASVPRRSMWWLAIAAWVLLVTAGSRPQWLGEAIELPVSGRDLMLAVDLSGSMEEQDFIIVRRANKCLRSPTDRTNLIFDSLVASGL